MNTSTQVILVLLVMAGVAYTQREPSSDPVQRKAHSSLATTSAQSSVHAQAARKDVQPHKFSQKKIPRKVAAISPAARRSQILPTPIQDLEIDRDLGLDEQTRSDLDFLFSIERREREYLVNVVGVNARKLHKILEQQKMVRDQLKTLPNQRTKHAVLTNHVRWMQSEIGVGHYNKFQEISFSAE